MPAKKRRQATPTVFISSTIDDLKSFRAAALEAARQEKFLAIVSEDFRAADEPPLDKCLAKVAEADLLVAIVAHRYGWKPKKQRGKVRKSITWLECEKAKHEKMDVLPFLVDKAADWPLEDKESYRSMKATDDGKLTLALQQDISESVANLGKFKEWLQERVRATFRSRDELRDQIKSALRQWRDKHPEFSQAMSPPDQGPADPSKYLRELFEDTESIEIRGLEIGTGRAHKYPIEQLYVPLTVTGDAGEMAGGSKKTGRSRQATGAPGRKPITLEETLRHARLVVVGDPGSGKSTFLRRIAYLLSGSHCGKRVAELEAIGSPFPIRIEIAALDSHIRNSRQTGRRALPSTDDSPDWLVDYLTTRSAEQHWGLSGSFFAEKLASGPAIVLLDGLDEAPDVLRRDTMRKLFEKAVAAYERCRFVVTSRPQSYDGETALHGFHRVTIEPLDDPGIDLLLQHWCDGLYHKNPRLAGRHLAVLREEVRIKPEIRRMAENPVMLTALILVHWNERKLPEKRAELYESVLKWLAKARARTGREPDARCLALLRHLALAMQDQPKGHAVEASNAWAAATLAPHFLEKPEPERLPRAEHFLHEEQIDSGIIVTRNRGVRFWHTTFGEYLAAKAIAGLTDAAQQDLLLTGGKIYRPEWRETALLLAGVLHEHGPDKVNLLISAMLRESADSLASQARCVGLVGSMVRDLAPSKFGPSDPAYQSALDSVLGIFTPAGAIIPLQDRIAAADALGQAGDPRLEKDNWVTIPAKPFLMGAQKTDPSAPNYDPETFEEDEPPAHEVSLRAYQIGRYPVTVSEFAKFIEAGGYQGRKYWKAGGFGKTGKPDDWDRQSTFRNRPVTGVNWFEAVAYCAWAGCRLASEAEWERAARGTTGRKYPWGPEPPDTSKANYFGGPGHVTPVGLFPGGATPEGIEDMAGNVWEWVADWYDPKYYSKSPSSDPTGPASGSARVLRGGGFFNYPRYLRAACRYRFEPLDRFNYIGFRCAREVS